MANFDPGAEAKLFRSEGEADVEMMRGGPIKEGSLHRMLEVALADADGEIWRYAIATDEGTLIKGEEIESLAKSWGIERVLD